MIMNKGAVTGNTLIFIIVPIFLGVIPVATMRLPENV